MTGETQRRLVQFCTLVTAQLPISHVFLPMIDSCLAFPVPPNKNLTQSWSGNTNHQPIVIEGCTLHFFWPAIQIVELINAAVVIVRDLPDQQCARRVVAAILPLRLHAFRGRLCNTAAEDDAMPRAGIAPDAILYRLRCPSLCSASSPHANATTSLRCCRLDAVMTRQCDDRFMSIIPRARDHFAGIGNPRLLAPPASPCTAQFRWSAQVREVRGRNVANRIATCMPLRVAFILPAIAASWRTVARIVTPSSLSTVR